jgi:uncharacterized protein (TIGR02678 family)
VSGALDGVLERSRAEELRRAARALLRRPLLRATGPGAEEFPLVRRYAGELREWFDANTGWRLVVDSEVARLVKRAPTTGDASHPARDPRSRAPFGRRRYVLTCLALSVLERSETQITLGRLAEGVILAAADEQLARAGVVFRLEGREQRGDLVAVVRLLLSLGVLSRVAGDEDAFVRDAGDALYDVERRSLAVLLAAPRGPSTIAAAGFGERLAQLAAEPVPDAEELRNRAIRHHLTRRLLDEPVIYHDALDASRAAYLGGQRTALARRVSELTGLVAEVRAEGIAMVDPEDDLTDVRMPDSGTDGHVTLLIAEHLAGHAGAPAGDGGDGGAVLVPEPELHRLVQRLAREHRAYWRRAAGDPGAEIALTDASLDRLEALQLVRREPGGVRPLPALARYALAAPTLPGATRETAG